MATEPVQTVTLAIILGTLVAIVYSLRILVLLERRIARMDHHVELLAMNILKDEKKLLNDEARLEKMVQSLISAPKKRSATKKKSSKKKPAVKKSSAKKKTSTKSAAKKSSAKKATKKPTTKKRASRKK